MRFTASNFMDQLFINLADPNLIKEFLNKQSIVSKKDARLYSGFPELLTNGLVFSEGEKWKAQRKLMSQVFHFDYINACIPIINNCVADWIATHCKTEHSVVDVSKELKLLTSTVIWRIFFGEEKIGQKDEASKLVELTLRNINFMIEQSLSPWNLLFGPKFFKLGIRAVDRQYQKDTKYLKDYFFGQLEKFKQISDGKSVNSKSSGESSTKTSNKNLIELLLEQARIDAKENPGDRELSDLEMVSQIYTFFLAGTDTSSELLVIAHYLLATYPDVQQKLREEIQTHIGKSQVITYEHISRMEYLNAFLKEALRSNGPSQGLLSRIATQDFMLSDLKILKGFSINIDVIGTANNPKYFKNPQMFRPERWIEKEELGVKDPFAFLPFSAGTRRCIGEQLALIESKILLCEVIRQFNIELKKPYQLKMKIGLVYHASDPINIIYSRI